MGGQTAGDSQSDKTQESHDTEIVDQALQHIIAGRLPQAEQLLLEVVSRAPAPENYVRQWESDGALHIKLWDMESFLFYITRYEEQPPPPEVAPKQIFWVVCAYPRAFYYLGFIYVARGDHQTAIKFLDAGARLEPDNAKFDLEKAQALAHSGQREATIEQFEKVVARGGEVLPSDRAVALRGLAVQYIDLERLDEAENFLRQSLGLEPDNKIAINELGYIGQIRAGGQRVSAGLTDSTAQDQKCAHCGKNSGAGAFGKYEGERIWVCERCLRRQQSGEKGKPWWKIW